jgi:hypothetical protein
MRVSPLAYNIKQSWGAGVNARFGFPPVLSGQRIRLRWFAVGMAGASTLTAQPVINNANDTHQISASITANNGNVTGVRADVWLNEMDNFGFSISGVNTGGTITFEMRADLYMLEDSDNGWPVAETGD